MTKSYTVIIPIAGHAFVDVEATSEDEAKDKAFNSVDKHHIEEWEALEQFNRGNVCFCPSPWNVEIEEN